MSSTPRDTTESGLADRSATGGPPSSEEAYAARQIGCATGLCDAIAPISGRDILVVNPPLGNPWHLRSIQAAGCAVTAVGRNARFLAGIREKHEGLDGNRVGPRSGRTASSRSGDGTVEWRVGEIGLFFPEEDSFDAICLMGISPGEWGLGPEALLGNALRGLREGGDLLWGALGVGIADPAWVRAAAERTGFRLDDHPAGRVSYDPFAPEAALFRLAEKTSRRVELEVFEQASGDLATRNVDDPAERIREAIELARRLEVRRGSRILVIGRTPDFWTERVLAGVAGRIDILVGDGADLAVERADFSFYPGLAAIEGGLELQGALRNPRNRIYDLGFLRPICSLKRFELICLALADEDRATFRTCVGSLDEGGRILVCFPDPAGDDVDEMRGIAADEGCALRFLDEVDYGPARATLFIEESD